MLQVRPGGLSAGGQHIAASDMPHAPHEVATLPTPAYRELIFSQMLAIRHFHHNHYVPEWYQRRFGQSNKRARKVGIVALARKLLIALWRYLERSELPEGAVQKDWRLLVDSTARRRHAKAAKTQAALV